ncbi:hypothetical protein JOD03_002037 [Chryseomicrobium aureum]|uniref:hypothetical protein n=1 Tax=Chryseomicrobium aureum TaxID=1441723 RepID=UPI00195B0F23|nr:hypothetical protein [Chryseomicrobium aureum]MBM7707100.1 hypothetical protein [Chryseomicrobium aureum]
MSKNNNQYVMVISIDGMLNHYLKDDRRGADDCPVNRRGLVSCRFLVELEAGSSALAVGAS